MRKNTHRPAEDEGAEGPPGFNPGDDVIIRCKVVRAEEGGALVVKTVGCKLPGHEDEEYTQTIVLHDARLAQRAE